MSRRKTRATESTLSLTPMIDIMTVLLAVFIVTAPLLTAGIDLDLPDAGQSVLTGDDHALQISVTRDGNFYIGDERSTVDEIVARAVAQRQENPRLGIMISGDRRANYGSVMQVMGALRDNGFTRVGLRTELSS
ncbi:MAG: biopolymer transporter ExbD [Alphaproteobacteria bacterium]|nr:biopolymer transporter ExbD [Alphaproteobacteria bacterium]